jgi:hypothetical protein
MEETRCECGANVSCECGPKEERMYSEEEIRNTLTNLKLVNPAHITMTDNGHGEFPDGYKLIENGVQYIIEKLKTNENK